MVDCPVVLRKKNISPLKTCSDINLDEGIQYNAKKVTSSLFSSNEVDKHYNSFMKKYGEYLKNSSKEKVGDEAKNIIFKNISFKNFCGATKTINYDIEGNTKIEGDNGVGKTVQYPTALLYALSGVIDTRFSEERMLVSDLGGECQVVLNGTVNEKAFTITRGHTGKKSILEFVLNGEVKKHPTVKQTQYRICVDLFNLYFPSGTCPHKGLMKVILQRIVWKQGGRESNFLKLSKDAMEQTFLNLFNKNYYVSFEKYLKNCLNRKNKELEKYRTVLGNIKIRLDERKTFLDKEHVGTAAWENHRRFTVENLKKNIQEEMSKAVEYPKTTKEIDAYLNHQTTLVKLKTSLQNMLDSSLGLQWKPEQATLQFKDASDELDECKDSLLHVNEQIDELNNCMTILKTLRSDMYKEICAKLQNYDSNIDFSSKKYQKLENGNLMKYLSGGEYEKKGLDMFLDFQKFLKEYKRWTCNLLIFDEPGTAMSTKSLQNFVNRLPKDKCCMIISHKNIKCDKTIKL